jgi:hypothetical protein
MDTLPREIHEEIVSWLAPEEQQMTRLVGRYWARLIEPVRVNLLEFGAWHGIVDYCEVGLLRGDSPSGVYSIAIRRGHLGVAVWARSRGQPWDERTCSWAAGNGRLEILKWLRGDLDSPTLQSGGVSPERNENMVCPWNETTYHVAALNGHLEILKYAHESGCPGNTVWTCANAARNGHLEVLKWARSNGYPWDTETCASAAKFGHLKVLKYAHESGCPWDCQNADVREFPKNTRRYILQLRELGGTPTVASGATARRW